MIITFLQVMMSLDPLNPLISWTATKKHKTPIFRSIRMSTPIIKRIKCLKTIIAMIPIHMKIITAVTSNIILSNNQRV